MSIRRLTTHVAFLGTILVALSVMMAAPGRGAQLDGVDLELVLAVDVSWSMDLEEQQLQRDGYVQAFRDPQIQKAIMSGPNRAIAVTYIEWAGPPSQFVVLPWTIIRSVADAERVADALAAAPISRHRMTSITNALDFSARQFSPQPPPGTRRVIDISGDGPNNAGGPVTEVRDRLVADGIVINGLPVVVRPSVSGTFFDIPNLEEYYEACVVGGPGAFVIAIRDKDQFATAIRQKLLLEISGWQPMPRVVPVQLKPPAPKVDCLVGEYLWRRYMDR